jgi:hypothetical protein
MSFLPIAAAGIGALGNIIGGNKQAEAAKRQFEWQKKLDTLGAGYTAQDRALGAANNNALTPFRRQLLATLTSRLGFEHPSYGQWQRGESSIGPVEAPNPLAPPKTSGFFDRVREAMGRMQ